jgi:HPt (histidine-containing phosphotransfer) domain-containing protein
VAQTFDEAELLDRVDNDTEFLAETVEMLVSDGPTLLGQIRDAIAAGDAMALGQSAHALKGMISNFCAQEAHAAAFRLESLGKAGDLAPAAPALETMEACLTALLDELSAFVKGRS